MRAFISWRASSQLGCDASKHPPDATDVGRIHARFKVTSPDAYGVFSDITNTQTLEARVLELEAALAAASKAE